MRKLLKDSARKAMFAKKPKQAHFTMKDYDSNMRLEDGGDIRNAIQLAKIYGTHAEVNDMESMLRGYESTGNTYNYEYDNMNRIDSKYYHRFAPRLPDKGEIAFKKLHNRNPTNYSSIRGN